MADLSLKARVQKRLQAVGKSPRSASIEAGGSPALLQNLLSGKSKSIRGDNLASLAAVLETTTDWLTTGAGPETPTDQKAQDPEVTLYKGELVPVRVAGTVEAGAFREANEFVEFETVTLWEPKDERFPQARLVAFTVSGDSMNDLKVDGRSKPILEGDRVICVDFSDLGGRLPIQDGMVVVVERIRDGGHLREWSVKQVEYYADRIEFHPRSTNPRHKPIVVPHESDRDDGTHVEILGLVRAVRTEMSW